ncbi:MAG: hypothetical protein AB2A00_39155, partial [Myxococcota bacterium]
MCLPATCNDGLTNGGETDVDCGGDTTCPRCDDGLVCRTDADCTSGYCNGICALPAPQFGYPPSNFDPSALSWRTASGLVLDCGQSRFDTSTLTFGNWCGEVEPVPVRLTQVNGPDVIVLPVLGVDVAAGSSLRLTGSLPVILAVFGNATIAGTIDASANGTTPGAGGDWSCGASKGGDGSGDCDGGGGGG